MQSDYSDQGVNWILTARSDICSIVVGNLSKWWTVIHWAAWSTCNLLHVMLWRAWPNGLYITYNARNLSMRLVGKSNRECLLTLDEQSYLIYFKHSFIIVCKVSY